MKDTLFKIIVVFGFVCLGVYIFKRFERLTALATGLTIQNQLLASEVKELRGVERKVIKGFAPA